MSNKSSKLEFKNEDELIDWLKANVKLSIKMDGSPDYYGNSIEAKVQLKLNEKLIMEEEDSYSSMDSGCNGNCSCGNDY